MLYNKKGGELLSTAFSEFNILFCLFGQIMSAYYVCNLIYSIFCSFFILYILIQLKKAGTGDEEVMSDTSPSVNCLVVFG